MRHLNFTLAEKVTLSVAALILGIGLMLASIWAYGWLVWVGVIVILVTLILNSLVQVDAEFTCYQTIFGRPQSRVLKSGLNIVWPFVTKVVPIETRGTNFEATEPDVNMPQGITVQVKYTIAYELTKDGIHQFADRRTPLDKAFPTSMAASIRATITRYECDELIDAKDKLENVRLELDHAFKEHLENTYYSLSVVFRMISVAKIDIIYPKGYLEERAKIVNAEQEAKAAKAQLEATKLLAEGKKIAILASGEAENAVLERLGEILKAHPEININELAKHFPQVFGGGGVMPTINMEQMLKGGKPQFDPNAK